MGTWGSFDTSQQGGINSGRRYRYAYRGRGYRRAGAQGGVLGVGGWVSLIILGAFTAGILYPFMAFGSWRGWARSRTSGLAGLTRRLLAQAIVFTVLTGLALLLVIAGIVGAHAKSTTSADDTLVNVPGVFGVPVTVAEPAAADGDGDAPVSVTVSDFTHPTTVTGLPADDTATAHVQLCATSTAISVFGAADLFSVVTLDGGFGSGDTFRLPSGDPLAGVGNLQPGQCVSGTMAFTIPTSSVITQIQYGIIHQVVYTVEQTAPSSTPSSTP